MGAPIHGFVGASSMERIPVEKGIRETTARFASLKIKKSPLKRKTQETRRKNRKP
jgi:hypothetical protein